MLAEKPGQFVVRHPSGKTDAIVKACPRDLGFEVFPEDTIAEADQWLKAHPVGDRRPKGPSRQAGIDLAEELDDYNNGLIGPGVAA